MTGHVDDALVVCLIAACLVVLAHGVDAIGARRREDGWWHSLALALCGLALCLLVGRLAFIQSVGDVIELLATAAAVTVSALPLVGVRGAGGERQRPANPWDRAYRITPARVAQLLSPAAPPRASRNSDSNVDTNASAHAVDSVRRTLSGVILDPPGTATHPRRASASAATPPPSSSSSDETSRPRVANGPTQEAAEALHEVEDVLNGVTSLLGLRAERRPRADPRAE
ncbi:hypothetical protein [Gephyromycinifex aptenodytis]|uniref:hypothetical protein n=1 Tax=Gephyromycinifex aptenodytis TaxID=2716227 RepID=UPI001445BEEC|nr:hypothetical protein [Gephyromycinifex aptenodytis]